MVDSDCSLRGSFSTQNSREETHVRDASSNLIVHDDDFPRTNRQQQSRLLQDAGDESDYIPVVEETKPLHYWDDLRRNSGIQIEARPDSALFRFTDPNNGETIRLGHVSNLYPYSEISSDGSTRIPNESLIYIQAGMFLAIKHFNERSASVLPDLPEILQGCNIYLTLEILDTILSPIVASRSALSVLNRPPASLQEPYPVALAGSFRSAVTQPLATLSGVYNVPHVNGQSTSSVLDNKDQAPTFTRVVPTNRLDAQAYVLYLKSLGVHHFACLFVRDAYGSEFNRDLRNAAAEHGLHMHAVSYQDGNRPSIDQAISRLKSRQHRYIFTVITPSAGTLKYILRQAIDKEILGNSDHFWMFSEAVTALLEPGFYRDTLDVESESDREMARALSGTGFVLLEIADNDPFHTAMQELRTDKELYDYFVSLHDAKDLFDGFRFDPAPNFYQSLSFDAIMALGIGLCGMEEEFPTGLDIVDAIKASEFVGVSGPVSFDNFTGTRTEEGLNFKIVNLLVDVTEDSIEFNTPTTTLINMTSGNVDAQIPFIYSRGTLEPPPHLPPPSVDTNLLSDGVRAIGWTLSATVIVLSVAFAMWTWKHRAKNLVRIAQPTFLILLCSGTAIMATAIIPLSLQEPVSEKGLDIACMATPWLFILGFAIAVASVLFKLVRLNRVFQQSAELHRVKVTARQFLRPFAVYMVTNFAILLSWTLVAPLEWTRVFEINNVDSWGRSLESYGTCYARLEDSKTGGRIAFASMLVAVNFLVLLFANYEGYRSRHVPSAFNETSYLFMSMAGVLEAFLIGIPLVFLARDNPTAMFMITSILITLICLALLMPTFGSKLFIRRRASTADAVTSSSMKKAWVRYDKQQMTRSHHGNMMATVEAIRKRAEEGSSGDIHGNTTVEAIRRRAAAKTAKEESSGTDGSGHLSADDNRIKKESSRQRITRK